MVLLHLPAAARTETWPDLSLYPVAGGFSRPVHITHSGDGSGRLFVVEQAGLIRILRNGVIDAQPFLDIRDRVGCCGERGLLSVAFPPDFPAKRYFYVDYTNLSGDTLISRFHLSSDPGIGEEILLRIDQPFENHNGGQIAFGPDGYLYIGMGDGGSSGDPQGFAQNLDIRAGNRHLLGKLLRIDVESGVTPYAIPPDNPVLNGRRSEIWAYGLRNPWRFSFDRSAGDLYIADVGQESFEEVDFQSGSGSGGENYGWNIMEGLHCFESSSCDTSGLTLPVAEYGHDQGCSVTGGFVYRGAVFPRMQGIYFYGDYCSGLIRGLRETAAGLQNVLLLDTALSITSFGEDEEGSVFVVDQMGDIYRLTDSAAVMPVPAGMRFFNYPALTSPVVSPFPETARPVAVAPPAQADDMLVARITVGPFAGPVDIYGAIVHPLDLSSIRVLRSDSTFQNFPADLVVSSVLSGVRPQGVTPWMENVLSEVDAMPLAPVRISDIASGTYIIYFMITPAERFDSFYIWTTQFSVP